MVLNDSNSTERRRFTRAKFQETITVHQVTESKSGNVYEVEGTPVSVKAQDVSEGGIRIEMGKLNPSNKIMKLNFQIPKNGSVDVYTKLAWAGGGQCGLQFVVLDEEIRKQIKGYVNRFIK